MKLKKGMILDLYREGIGVKRVVMTNDTDAMCLRDRIYFHSIDLSTEVLDVLIEDIFEY